MNINIKNQLILLKIKNLILSKEFEIAKATRENNMGNWLSDHDGAIRYYDNEISLLEKEME